MPYLRGFKNRFRVEYQTINVGDLAEMKAGDTLTIADLVASGVFKAHLPIKLLGDGDLNIALTVEVHKVSANAKTKIEAAGGKVIETPWQLVRPSRSFGVHSVARGPRE